MTSDILRPYFASEITRMREKRGWSQEKLAKEAKIDPGTLRRLERGEAPAREDYVFNICRALNTEAGDLVRRVVAAYEEAQKTRKVVVPEDDPIHGLIGKIRDRHEASLQSQREYREACLELMQVLILRLRGE